MILVENMHCSSIGARKKHSICHTMFLVNRVLNDALYTKWDDIDFQIYDKLKQESEVMANSSHKIRRSKKMLRSSAYVQLG